MDSIEREKLAAKNAELLAVANEVRCLDNYSFNSDKSFAIYLELRKLISEIQEIVNQ